DGKRAPSERTWLTSAPPRPEDRLRLTLRRRIPLPSGARGGESQRGSTAIIHATIGGKEVPLTGASLAVIDWLFDHDRSSRADVIQALAPRHESSAVDAAILQLMHGGLVVAERAV
ncbi:MAG TPA: hypothetical protein VGG33_08850, partial [Polyangia bacterium]